MTQSPTTVATLSPTKSPVNSPTDFLPSTPVVTGQGQATMCPNVGSNDSNDQPLETNTLSFTYAIQTNEDADIQSVVSNVEDNLSLYLAEHKLECDKFNNERARARRMQNLPTSRKLVVVGMDPAPLDTIVIEDTYCDPMACCAPGCSLITGHVTFTQTLDSEPSASSNCHIYQTVGEYMNTLKPDDIEGLEQIYLIGHVFESDEEKTACESLWGPASLVSGDHAQNEKDDMPFLIAAGVGGGVLLAFIALFVQRRRSRMDNSMKREIPLDMTMSLDGGDDNTVTTHSRTIPEIDPIMHWSTVDVHTCKSAICDTCRNSEAGQSTEFVKVDILDIVAENEAMVEEDITVEPTEIDVEQHEEPRQQDNTPMINEVPVKSFDERKWMKNLQNDHESWLGNKMGTNIPKKTTPRYRNYPEDECSVGSI